MYPTAILLGLIALGAGCGLHFALGRKRPRERARTPYWEWTVLLATLLCVILLGISGWLEPMTGLTLLVHTGVGAAFAVGLALLSVPWAVRCYFTGTGSWGERGLFWLTTASGLVAVLSILLGMFPLLDSGQMRCLMEVHRYSALGAVIGFVATVYHKALGRRGR